jgi:hypothetical protein
MEGCENQTMMVREQWFFCPYTFNGLASAPVLRSTCSCLVHTAAIKWLKLFLKHCSCRIHRFSRPNGVCVLDGEIGHASPDGPLAVISDLYNHRLCVYRIRDGTLMRHLGSFGDAPGQFKCPLGVAIVRWLFFSPFFFSPFFSSHFQTCISVNRKKECDLLVSCSNIELDAPL